jgi:hypothetical protein
MEFYSVTKKNEILSFAGKWMELENIILSNVSQAQKGKKSHVRPNMWIIDLNECSSIIGHVSHTKGRIRKGEIREGKLKLQCF